MTILTPKPGNMLRNSMNTYKPRHHSFFSSSCGGQKTHIPNMSEDKRVNCRLLPLLFEETQLLVQDMCICLHFSASPKRPNPISFGKSPLTPPKKTPNIFYNMPGDRCNHQSVISGECDPKMLTIISLLP